MLHSRIHPDQTRFRFPIVRRKCALHRQKLARTSQRGGRMNLSLFRVDVTVLNRPMIQPRTISGLPVNSKNCGSRRLQTGHSQRVVSTETFIPSVNAGPLHHRRQRNSSPGRSVLGLRTVRTPGPARCLITISLSHCHYYDALSAHQLSTGFSLIQTEMYVYPFRMHSN